MTEKESAGPFTSRKSGKKLRPPALRPGEMIHVGEQLVDRVSVRVIDYSLAGVREIKSPSVSECIAFEGRDSPAWIQVVGLHETEMIGQLLEAYGIHPLVRDDIVNTDHQPKLEDFGSYLFITLKEIKGGAEPGEIEIRQVSFILTDRVLLSFHEAPTHAFDPVEARLREGSGRLRSSGADYLLWALLDALLDQYLMALHLLEDKVTETDDQLSELENDVDMSEIHNLRQRTSLLYRTVRPIREIVIGLQRSETNLLGANLVPFFRDLYDHAWHAIETADRLREAVMAIREFHQANLAQRMNAVMKALAVISTIFLPLTFLTGFFGMNFPHLPLLENAHGHWIALAGFVLVGLVMYLLFRRRRFL